jgi:hypothetical protein
MKYNIISSDYSVSPTIAWQSWDTIDLLFVLNNKNKKFYYFEDTAKFVTYKIFKHMSLDDIITECLYEYEIDESDLRKNIAEFYQLLLHEGIIHENRP